MAVRLPPNPTNQTTFMDIANGHGYSQSIKYAWEGKESCRSVANALDAWCKAEEAHAASLKKIANSYELPTYSETGSTLNTSWQALKLGMLHHGRNAEAFAKKLREQQTKFVDFRHSQSKVKRSLEAEMKAANKSLNDSKSVTNKLKQKYVSVCKTTQSNVTKRNHLQDDPKAKADSVRKSCAKVEKLMKDVEKTDLNYQAQIDTLNLEEISHRDKMDRVLQDLQVVEETRITNTKDLLYTVSTAAMEVFSTTMEGWGGVTEGVTAINLHTDIKRFVMRQCSEAAAKGNMLPNLIRTDYEVFESKILDDEGRTSTRILERRTTPDTSPPVSIRLPPPHPSKPSKSSKPSNTRTDTTTKTTGSGETKQSAPATSTKNGPPGMHEEEEEKEIPQKKGRGGSSPPGMQHDEDRTAFPLPPRIPAPSRSAPAVPKSGPPGMSATPDVTPPSPAVKPPPRPSKKLPTNMIWARGTFNFKGEESDDLSFNESDLIHIVDKSAPDWWKGKLNGKGNVGSFPSNYCELIFQDGNMKNGIAKFDFSSDEPGEISFKEGDAIEIVSVDDSSGWWEGRRANGTGAVGLFPSNRITLC